MKRWLKDPFVFVLIGFIFLITVYLFKNFLVESPAAKLAEVQSIYQEAETETNAVKRKDAFNNSLKIFLDLEKKYSPTFGNGKLYFDIGNNFFQLEDYPRAILYYNRAALLRPRDAKISRNILAAQNQLKMEKSDVESSFQSIFFFHNYLSLPERLQIFAFLAVLALLFISTYFWIRKGWLYVLGLIFTTCAGILLLSIGFSYYLTPVQAIIVRSSAIYRDAGEQYAKVTEKPIPSGSKVKVLDQSDSGKWIKIQMADGTVGYVPFEALRLI